MHESTNCAYMQLSQAENDAFVQRAFLRYAGHNWGMTSSHSQTAEYVRFLLERTGCSPSALARKAGISPTTLTRKLSAEGPQFSLSMKSIDKLERATNWSYGKYIELANSLKYVESLIDVNTIGSSAQKIGLVDKSIPVIGSVCAGLWYEKGLLEKEAVSYLPFRSGQPDLKYVSFRVKGNSCDEIAQDGEIIICTPSRADYEFRTPEIVIVEATKQNTSLVERTMRVVAKPQDAVSGRGFRYASSDPEVAAMPVECESEFVRAVADVQWVVRRASLA